MTPGWLLQANANAKVCSFCGKPFQSFYESKLLELDGEKRTCCTASWSPNGLVQGCDTQSFKDLPPEERAKFHYYTDG